MLDNNVILFLRRNYEASDVQGCEGKVIGTNVAQEAIMSTGDTLIFVIKNTSNESQLFDCSTKKLKYPKTPKPVPPSG